MVERGNDVHRRILSRITNLDTAMLDWTETLCNYPESAIPPDSLREPSILIIPTVRMKMGTKFQLSTFKIQPQADVYIFKMQQLLCIVMQPVQDRKVFISPIINDYSNSKISGMVLSRRELMSAQ